MNDGKPVDDLKRSEFADVCAGPESDAAETAVFSGTVELNGGTAV